jgi:hypothetical protein
MTLEEIKAAVEAGHVVHWHNSAYKVVKDSLGQWLVKCTDNGHCIGLTFSDGVTMNGEPEEFFMVFKGGVGFRNTVKPQRPVVFVAVYAFEYGDEVRVFGSRWAAENGATKSGTKTGVTCGRKKKSQKTTWATNIFA